VSATLTGPANVAGEPVTFSIGGSTLTALTNSSGVASVNLPLVDLPAGYELTASFAGDAADTASSGSAPFTITKLATTLTLAGGPSALFGSSTGITATLTSSSVGLAERTVGFVLTPSGGGAPITQTRTTDFNGKAPLGTIAGLPPGTYTVEAYFGGVASTVTLPSDPVFNATTSSPIQLTVGFSAPCITGSNSGNLVVGAGKATCIASGAEITGSLTVKAGGALWVSGATISAPLISTGATNVTICGSTLSGGETVSGTTGPVLEGGPAGSGCAGNSITGTAKLTANLGGVTFVGNTATAPISLTHNRNGFQYSENTDTGSVTLTDNT
jgi:hypothetical protein